MLNKITIFLLLFLSWIIGLFLIKEIKLFSVIFGFFTCIFIIIFLFKATIITNNTKFLFLQFSFYKYIFSKVFSKFFYIIDICSKFIDPKTKFTSIVDYIFLNKDSDSESGFIANLLNILPGTFGILMKKRYLIVHSLDLKYFSLKEMYDISNEVVGINDDSLI